MKYILRISSPDFGKPQKFHDFIFSFPGIERNDFHLLPRLELFFFPRKEKSSLFKKICFFI